MKKEVVPTISLAKLLNTFEDSGFTINLVSGSARMKGQIKPDHNEIYINKNLSGDERIQTFLHEVIHLYDDSLNEEQTETAALALFATLSEAELGYIEFLVS